MDNILKSLLSFGFCLIPLWIKLVADRLWPKNIKKLVISIFVLASIIFSVIVVSIPSANLSTIYIVIAGAVGYLVWVVIGAYLYWPRK